MCANIHLLDFSVDPAHLTGEGQAKLEKEVVAAITTQLETTKEGKEQEPFPELEKVLSKQLSPLGDYLAIYAGPRNSVISIRSYPTGLLTVNVEYYLQDGDKPLLTLENIKALEMYFGGKSKEIDPVKAFRVKTFPPVKRGAKVDVYMTTTDERLMEYDVDKIIFDQKSPFQHVQILHSLTFGNMLVLDDLQNLAESDLIYTESIMCRGTEDYKDKEILILGGGDGALLYELRKENPKFVTMIEIDDLVMQVCKIHLRSACGNTLDNYKGSNYEIIVGDCVEYMKNCGKEGKKFDYVFADLTDIPISPTPQGEIWDFIRLILNLSFSVMKPDGRYMTHGNGSSSPSALKMFEEVLDRLEDPVEWSRTHNFVPSFMEDWVFYQIQRKQSSPSS
ncbi:spermine synthase isoform X1 [Folsomia candida]|uniref:spermine synthase isoform X1 n=1 Tax=Folsomia candida TaxID=158441 RepID=UPI000B9051A6|nr:spermine synthase isoform X1 [Folsomia candida]